MLAACFQPRRSVHLKTKHLVGPVRGERVFAILQHLGGFHLIQPPLQPRNGQMQGVRSAAASARERVNSRWPFLTSNLYSSRLSAEILSLSIMKIGSASGVRAGEDMARHGERGVVLLAFLFGVARFRRESGYRREPGRPCLSWVAWGRYNLRSRQLPPGKRTVRERQVGGVTTSCLHSNAQIFHAGRQTSPSNPAPSVRAPAIQTYASPAPNPSKLRSDRQTVSREYESIHARSIPSIRIVAIPRLLALVNI